MEGRKPEFFLEGCPLMLPTYIIMSHRSESRGKYWLQTISVYAWGSKIFVGGTDPPKEVFFPCRMAHNRR